MATTLKTLVEERLSQLGRNPSDAARRGSLERTFIVDILNGRKRSVRGENIAKLAAAIDMSPEQVLAAGHGGAPPMEPTASGLRIPGGINLTPAEFADLGRACVQWMTEHGNEEGGAQMREALLEVVQRLHGNVDPRYLDDLRDFFAQKYPERK